MMVFHCILNDIMCPYVSQIVMIKMDHPGRYLSGFLHPLKFSSRCQLQFQLLHEFRDEFYNFSDIWNI